MKPGKQTILIVDDSLLIIERVTLLLKELETVGHIKTAASYDEAVKVLAEIDHDIAFLDIQLPGKNGIELLHFIKKNYPAIEVVMLTNESAESYRDLCKQAGASHFIDKSSAFEMIPRILSSLSA